MRIAQGAGVRLGGSGTTGDDRYLRVRADDGITPVDPDTLLFTLAKDGTITDTYGGPAPGYGGIGHPGLGLFYADVPAADVAELGHYQWYAATTNPTGVFAWQEFDVIDPLAPALLTLTAAQQALGKTARGVQVDLEELQLHADVATEQIERMCRGDAVVPRTVVETVTVERGRLRLRYGPDPVLSAATLGGTPVEFATQWAADGQVIAARAGYTLLPDAAYVLTYRAGLSPIPASLHLAARVLLKHLWKVEREQAPGAAGEGLDLVQTPYGFAIPNRVAELVRPWAKGPGIA